MKRVPSLILDNITPSEDGFFSPVIRRKQSEEEIEKKDNTDLHAQTLKKEEDKPSKDVIPACRLSS